MQFSKLVYVLDNFMTVEVCFSEKADQYPPEHITSQLLRR